MDETQQESCQCSNTHQLSCLLQAAGWSSEELNLLLTQDVTPGKDSFLWLLSLTYFFKYLRLVT